MISVYKNAKLNAMEMSRLFFESDFFEFSEPNFVLFDILNSNDAHFNQQWALNNTGQNGGTPGVDIKAEQAWQISTGTNIKVAVIDEGVDLTHPDLQANLLPGYDATGGNSGGAPTNSGESHGTACAGIIGAIKDNGQGISGIAPNCKILPINVTFGNKVTTSNWLANAINWAWWNGADIISNSWGGGSAHTGITNAINEAITRGRARRGCLVVFASGNTNASVVYPANLNSNILVVGAISPCGQRKSYSSCDWENWWGSCYGPQLDIVAPGVKI